MHSNWSLSDQTNFIYPFPFSSIFLKWVLYIIFLFNVLQYLYISLLGKIISGLFLSFLIHRRGDNELNKKSFSDPLLWVLFLLESLVSRKDLPQWLTGQEQGQQGLCVKWSWIGQITFTLRFILKQFSVISLFIFLWIFSRMLSFLTISRER